MLEALPELELEQKNDIFNKILPLLNPSENKHDMALFLYICKNSAYLDQKLIDQIIRKIELAYVIGHERITMFLTLADALLSSNPDKAFSLIKQSLMCYSGEFHNSDQFQSVVKKINHKTAVEIVDCFENLRLKCECLLYVAQNTKEPNEILAVAEQIVSLADSVKDERLLLMFAAKVYALIDHDQAVAVAKRILASNGDNKIVVLQFFSVLIEILDKDHADQLVTLGLEAIENFVPSTKYSLHMRLVRSYIFKNPERAIKLIESVLEGIDLLDEDEKGGIYLQISQLIEYLDPAFAFEVAQKTVSYAMTDDFAVYALIPPVKFLVRNDPQKAIDLMVSLESRSKTNTYIYINPLENLEKLASSMVQAVSNLDRETANSSNMDQADFSKLTPELASQLASALAKRNPKKAFSIANTVQNIEERTTTICKVVETFFGL